MESKKSKKKILIILLFLLLVIGVFVFTYSYSIKEIDNINKENNSFYKELYDYLGNDDYLRIDDVFLRDNDLFDEEFVCENITFEDGILEFFNCDIEDDFEDFCSYDGIDFICYDNGKNEEVDLDNELEEDKNNSSNNVDNDNFSTVVVPSNLNVFFTDNIINLVNGYATSDITLSINAIENSSNVINSLYYCTTKDSSCNPSNKLNSDKVVINEDGESLKVCVKALYNNENYSDIICSKSYNLDKTGPIIDYEILGESGLNGWYTSNVSINVLNSSDNLSGVESVVVSKDFIDYDTSLENVIITAIDKVGNKSEKIIPIKIDKTAPISADFDIVGDTGNNDWYTSDIRFGYTGGSDSLSGINSVTFSKNIINYDVKDEVIMMTTMDNAGNKSISFKKFSVDKTAPIINDLTIVGLVGDNGWYKSNVFIDENGSVDSLSGVFDTTINYTSLTEETDGTKIIVESIDKAGNKSLKEIVIKIDKTAPVISTPLVNGVLLEDIWYTTDAYINVVDAIDNLSGHSNTSSSIDVINYDTVLENIIIRSSDLAGNISEKVYSIKVDKSGPIFNGINDLFLQVGESVNLRDGVSTFDNVSSMSSSFVVNPSTISTAVAREFFVTYSAVDNAGNLSTKIRKIVVDNNLPNITFTPNSTFINSNGWASINFDVEIGITHNYSSIVNQVNYCVGKGSCVPNNVLNTSSPLVYIEEEGSDNVICVNVLYSDGYITPSQCSSNFKLDKSAPIIGDAIINSTLGNDGWYVSDVNINDFNASDSVSGIDNKDISKSLINYETKGENIILTAYDLAGNKSERIINIKTDFIKPTAGEIIVNGTLGSDGWYSSDIELDAVNGTDLISGHKETLLDIEYVVGSSTGTDVKLTTKDNAGWESSVSESIKIDKNIPLLGDIIIYGTLGLNNWYVSDVLVSMDNDEVILSDGTNEVVDILSLVNNTKKTTISIITIDGDGNKAYDTVEIKIDKDKPKIELNTSILNYNKGDDHLISDFIKVEYSMSGGTYSCNYNNINELVDDTTIICTAVGGNGLSSTLEFDIDLFVGISQSTSLITNDNGGIYNIKLKGEPDYTKNATIDSMYNSLPATCTGTYCASKATTTNESGLYAYEDSLGTSYFFRGTINNNWFKFDDYYWRISSIESDGSIKLVYSGENAPNESQSYIKSGSDMSIGSSNFNSLKISSEYIGYTYTVGEQHGLDNDSNVKMQLEDWFENNLLDSTEFLADNSYCYDRNIFHGKISSLTLSGNPGFGSSGNTHFASRGRLFEAVPYKLKSNAVFELECSDVEDSYTVDSSIGNGILKYPIGLLTLDEVVLNGYGVGYYNQFNFLNTGENYWIGTPSRFVSGSSYNMSISALGLVSNVFTTNNYGTRPVISIKSDVLIKGSGLYNDPYEIINP